ncbi:MauE/DoxX family redox-associated membrane protein [Pseudonocardia bannensis]|uniref:DoxX family membrane protein n=1 Tax=Pseudonocardia bannensis TaxID=630973 RepID=A0A848DT65_9PSEU|nr:MauE/DoxX family redox-associated membrane protein [Pseudonocardia bannensis]NMH95394.1 DoxX family membrane protein [Pseudonocardia bannensis]
MRQGSARALDVIGTLARFGLAGIWLVSGVLKAADPDQTYIAVRAYDVLPTSGVAVVADVLPWLEIALGLLLLVGVGTRLVAGLSAAVLLVFMAGVVQAWARGLAIDCGCFGGGGQVAPEETEYGLELLRDTGFLLLAAWLLVRPRTLFALDDRLESRPVVRSGEGRN